MLKPNLESMNAEELRTFAALRIPAIVNAVSTRS